MEAPCTFEMIPVDALSYDYSNPRISQYLEIYRPEDLTPEHIYLALGKGQHESDPNAPTFHSLEESIRTHGRIIHPIIVHREAPDRLVVIEGNTRLAIYRRFIADKEAGDWTAIPAMVYTGLDQASIDAIRLQTHLVGARPWQAYSKAKYLDYLRNSKHLTMAQVVAFCGGRQREVQDYLAAYRDMETYYRPNLPGDDAFDPSRFSAFVELQRARVRRSILDAKFDLNDFAKWVIDRRLYPLAVVRDLPRILTNDRARQIFLEQGAAEALKVLDVPVGDVRLQDVSLETLAREMARRVRAMSYSDVRTLRGDPTAPVVQVLQDARDELSQLCDDLRDED